MLEVESTAVKVDDIVMLELLGDGAASNMGLRLSSVGSDSAPSSDRLESSWRSQVASCLSISSDSPNDISGRGVDSPVKEGFGEEELIAMASS